MRIEDQDLVQLEVLLDPPLRALLRQTLYLLERENRQPKSAEVTDYGFLVYSGALVYEGFLKRFFYTLELISLGQFGSDHFRIGKALNPDLPERYRDEGWVYGPLTQICGTGTATELWRAWKLGRNQVFHYDFVHGKRVSLAQAEEKIALLLDAMLAAASCEGKVKRGES